MADGGAVGAGPGGGNPFARGTVLLMVAIGFAAFLGLLYAIGAGGSLRPTDNGAAHGASASSVGYAALGRLLEKTGTQVQYGRSPSALQGQDLLIVTPEPSADPMELAALVNQRAFAGPTIIILPKWTVTPEEGLKSGWVRLDSPFVALQSSQVLSELIPVRTKIEGLDNAFIPVPFIQPEKPQNRGAMIKQALKSRITITGDRLKTVIADGPTGKARVAVIDDGGWYPSLDADAPETPDDDPQIERGRYPVVIVADADLMNNLGLANRDTARQALQLIDAAYSGGGQKVVFDLTQNGLGTSDNLLSVAFRPPFLAAVICLALAAIAFGWIAFHRFGPALAEAQPFGFGKTALINSSAGLIRRMGRDHLVAPAYADVVRDRAARALGLPPALASEEVEARLAMVAPDSDGRNFEALVAAMRAARTRPDIAAAARALNAWKKERIG